MVKIIWTFINYFNILMKLAGAAAWASAASSPEFVARRQTVPIVLRSAASRAEIIVLSISYGRQRFVLCYP